MQGDCNWYWRKILKLRPVLNPSFLDQCTINGGFKQSKCYDILAGSTNHFPIYKQVWCSLALPRHRFVFWVAVQQRLLTGDRLARWIQGIEINCLVCHSAAEDHSHRFFACLFSKAMVTLVEKRLGIAQMQAEHCQCFSWLQDCNMSSFVQATKVAAFQAIVYTGIFVSSTGPAFQATVYTGIFR